MSTTVPFQKIACGFILISTYYWNISFELNSLGLTFFDTFPNFSLLKNYVQENISFWYNDTWSLFS
jgi:hypothetical protein